MKLSKLTELPTSRGMIDVFGGYNHNLRIGEGEFYDMTNLTSADYPVLSPRCKRGAYEPVKNACTHCNFYVQSTEKCDLLKETIDYPDTSVANDCPLKNASTPEKPLGMIAKDALCYVEANEDGETSTFYINGYPINFEGNDTLNAEPKTLISMGSYVIIMPDKLYINTNNYEDKGKIEKTFDAKTGTAQFTLCKLDGEGYDIPEGNIGDSAPVLPEGKEEHDDLTLWLDTSGETHVLKQYSQTNSQWVSVATTYIKISFPNTTTDLTELFSNEDGVTISGITASEQLEDLNNTMVAWEVGKDYIIVTGILDKTATQELSDKAYISISRVMPKMDFIIESGNRLWGCRYGLALNGEVVNEIYASKLGDFKNWNTFAGISTDSYVVGVGTDGQFTGAIAHGGYPIFFKENCMHKVYGNYPANYQVQTIACRGVQKGCQKSLAIVNEILFYKSRSAICAYDGSLPVEMSSALGDVVYSDAVAGGLGNKYYISMKDASGVYHLFVYDTMKGMWHREDNTRAVEYCTCEGELYYIDYATNRIKTVRGTGTTDTAPIKWEAVTGIIGTESPDKKYLSRIVLRGSMEVGSILHLQAMYDSSGTWEQVFAMSAASLKTFSIPIKPKRCDHLRLRFVGQGEAKIFSITKTFEQGSDV